ncbi:corrinoid ABC transporter permease [Cutibacterium acnes JCM 18918]|nr:corrinoid ABC transporter permease [Cutibacterium acnes JCM 18918]
MFAVAAAIVGVTVAVCGVVGFIGWSCRTLRGCVWGRITVEFFPSGYCWVRSSLH